MKILSKLSIYATLILFVACAKITDSPVGLWRGNEGSDVVKLRLEDGGSSTFQGSGLNRSGTWKQLGPGKAEIALDQIGEFRMKDDNLARFTIDDSIIEMRRIFEVSPVSKSTPDPKPAVPREIPLRESYHVNEIP